MKNVGPILAATALCFNAVLATPPPSRTEPRDTVEERQLLAGLIGFVDGVLDDLGNALDRGDRDGVLDALHELRPTATPTNVEEAQAMMAAVATAKPSNLIEYNAHLITNGLILGAVGDLFDYAEGLFSEMNGHENSNPDPPKAVYPKSKPCDPRYTMPESVLRSAIYIPDTFTYGAKPPVVLFPGTGSTGYTTFAGNFIPLLTDVDWADPVWVNVPNFLNDDAQTNAEFAAYALNYIASLTKRKTSVIAWSQGNIDMQWAFKYWPSTRKVTTDHVAISADYRGTILANVVGVVGVLNTPAVLQQRAGSDFITTLRLDGGGSGYVPTTSIYSGFFDEIVQPQSGRAASAFLFDARNVGVTNHEVQVVCKGKPAGGLYTHESLLANPLTFALAKDALTHDGPGRRSRINLDEVCSLPLAPGLGLDELLITENAILIAGISLALYLPKSLDEPEIMQYALKGSATC